MHFGNDALLEFLDQLLHIIEVVHLVLARVGRRGDGAEAEHAHGLRIDVHVEEVDVGLLYFRAFCKEAAAPHHRDALRLGVVNALPREESVTSALENGDHLREIRVQAEETLHQACGSG